MPSPFACLRSASDEEEEEAGAAGDQAGLATPSGFASTATMTTIAGMETPDTIELRKDRRGEETPTGPKALYSVIPTKEVRRRTELRVGRAWAAALICAAMFAAVVVGNGHAANGRTS